jgi:hypothetical protein
MSVSHPYVPTLPSPWHCIKVRGVELSFIKGRSGSAGEKVDAKVEVLETIARQGMNVHVTYFVRSAQEVE